MLRNERGSALLVSLILVLVIAMLGAALFNLGVVESRMVLGSESDYRAFEIAQSGLDRMLYRLYLDFCGNPACTGTGSGLQDWADGDINGDAFPVSGSSYSAFPLAGNQLASGPMGEVGGVGTYTVQLRHLTGTEIAAHFFVTCQTVTGLPAGICKDAILVQSTGNYTVGTVTSSRTIQVLARARDTSTGSGGGLTGGASSGAAINGNVRIAGSVHVVGCATPPCAGMDDLDLGGAAGIQNNYQGMPNEVQRRIPRLPKVCLSSNPGCDPATQGVETLGAQARLAAPILAPALSLSGTATVGSAGGTVSYTYNNGTSNETIVAKANIDGIYVANGCQTANCSDNYGGNKGAQNVYSDNGVTNPYDISPPQPLATLRDYPVNIGGNTYNNYACAGVAPCNGADFFGLHAATFTDPPDGFTRAAGIKTSAAGGPDPPTADFNRTVTWWDPLNHPGAVTPTTPRQGCVAFRQSTATLSFHQGACPTTGEGSLDGSAGHANLPPVATHPLTSTTYDPANGKFGQMLVYIDGTFRIQHPLTYQGAAIIVTSGKVTVDESLGPPACTGICPPSDVSTIFPRQHVLGLTTPADMDMGMTGGGPEIFGFFYSGGLWRTTKQAHFVGSGTARTFDFTNVPRFWQVTINDPNSLMFPTAAKKFDVVSSHWRLCPGTAATSSMHC